MAPKKRDRSKSNRIMVPKKSESGRSKRNRIKRERRAAIKNNEAELTPGEIKTLEKKSRTISCVQCKAEAKKGERQEKGTKKEESSE